MTAQDRCFSKGKWAIVVAASVAMVLLAGCTHSTCNTRDNAQWTPADGPDFPTYSLAAGDSLGRSVFANGSTTSQAGFANLDCFQDSTVAALNPEETE